MPTNREVGRRIKEARQELRLTQKGFAEKIGLAEAQSVSNYERGIHEIPLDRLERIAEVTGKPLAHFITDNGLTVVPQAPLEAVEGAVREQGRAQEAIFRLATANTGRLDTLEPLLLDIVRRLEAIEQLLHEQRRRRRKT